MSTDFSFVCFVVAVVVIVVVFKEVQLLSLPLYLRYRKNRNVFDLRQCQIDFLFSVTWKKINAQCGKIILFSW